MNNDNFPREFYIKAEKPDTFKITIFLGIYNGSSYLGSLRQQLSSQTNQEFHLVITDNNSSDNSFEELKGWELDFPNRITILRNEINLGGSGTLLNSFDLFRTPWFAAFHQDDSYSPNHIEVLLAGINNAERDVVAVSTVMASMSGDGSLIGTVPRASMFAKSNSPLSAFLQNLRTHSVPWPASAFRCDIFEKTFSPWHSTAFPDTEQILRMCSFGRFITVDQETMHYRENQNSESHAIQSLESQIGVAVSLVRFFNGKEYQNILESVDQEKMETFLSEMIDALEFRLKGNPLAGFVILVCLEGLIEAWGYTNKQVIKLGYESYFLIKSELSSSLFARLGQSYHEMSQEELLRKNPSSISELVAIFPSADSHMNLGKKLILQQTGHSFFQALPYKLKKIAIKLTIRAAQKLGKFKNFHFR
jgi:hypothetical protein